MNLYILETELRWAHSHISEAVKHSEQLPAEARDRLRSAQRALDDASAAVRMAVLKDRTIR